MHVSSLSMLFSVMILVKLIIAFLSVGCLWSFVDGEAGVHCVAVMFLDPSTNNTAAVNRCVECTFPQNCLDNNFCAVGTNGKMCEKCQKGYHHVGNQCSPCPVIPWSAVAFGAFILLNLVVSCYRGFTGTVSIKMRLLCHFLQYLHLTFLIKLPWPELITTMAAMVVFGTFDGKVIATECLFPNWSLIHLYYIDWLTTLLVPLATLLLVYLLEKSLRTVQTVEPGSVTRMSELHIRQSRVLQQKAGIRRLLMFVLLVMYMPSTLSAIQTYQCAESIPQDQLPDPSRNEFFRDHNFTCETTVFQAVHFFATLYLIFVGLLFPMTLIFFTLRQRKWNLLHSKAHQFGSAVYEAYKDTFCFWEAVPLLRMLASIVVVEMPPVKLSAKVQTYVHGGLTAGYVLAVMILRPYRSCYWASKYINIHILFEILSNLCVIVVQVIGWTVIEGYYLSEYATIVSLTMFTVVGVWMAVILALPWETQDPVEVISSPPSRVHVSEIRQRIPSRSRQQSRRTCCWPSSKVEQDPEFERRLEQNQRHLNF